jgi:ubiquitin-protein ligase
MTTTNNYTNHPNSIAINRINFDKTLIEESYSTLDKEEIYFHFPESDSVNTHYMQLLVGTSDTPYEGGFYIFKGQFPDMYPFKPMTMKSLTQGGKIRKHPNLYVCGKCCFSFLGTWSGPPWTACNNAKSVAFSMRSVLTKFPLENEPGWENIKEKQSQHSKYAQLITYFNLKYAVCSIVENIDNKFTYFKEPIIRHFIKNYDNYIKTLNGFNNTKEKISGKSPVYGFDVTIDYDDLLVRFQLLHQKYIASPNILSGPFKIDNSTELVVNKTKEETDNESIVNIGDDKEKTNLPKINNTDDIVPVNANKSKPDFPASHYETGHIVKINSLVNFKVVEYKRNDKIYKRWLRYKI